MQAVAVFVQELSKPTVSYGALTPQLLSGNLPRAGVCDRSRRLWQEPAKAVPSESHLKQRDSDSLTLRTLTCWLEETLFFFIFILGYNLFLT